MDKLFHKKALELADSLGVEIVVGESPQECGINVSKKYKDIPSFYLPEFDLIYFNTLTAVDFDERTWILFHELGHAVCDRFPVKLEEKLEEHTVNHMAVAWCVLFDIPISERFVGHISENVEDLYRGKGKIKKR